MNIWTGRMGSQTNEKYDERISSVSSNEGKNPTRNKSVIDSTNRPGPIKISVSFKKWNSLKKKKTSSPDRVVNPEEEVKRGVPI